MEYEVENDDAVVGIEVKAGTNIDADSFKHLKWFKANMTEGKSFNGIVLYSGEYPVPFGDGLWAIPTSALLSSPDRNVAVCAS